MEKAMPTFSDQDRHERSVAFCRDDPYEEDKAG